MPTLTVNEAAEAPAQKTNAATVPDARGRKITIRKLGPVERMRLARLVGPEGAKNETYMGYATLAFTVTDIDGEKVFPPLNEREIEVIVGLLDDDGLEAVGNGYIDHFGLKPTTEADRDALKN